MDIKELLGDAYVEGMSIDDINAALSGKTFVDQSTLPKTVSKELFDKKTSELAKAIKERDSLKEANMTAEERVKAREDLAAQTISDYNKKSSRLDVEQILVQAGLKSEDYKSVIESLVTEDSAESIERANALVTLMNAQKEQVKENLKKELRESLPDHPKGKEGGETTEDDFNKLSLTEKMKFKEEHPEEYEILSNGGN